MGKLEWKSLSDLIDEDRAKEIFTRAGHSSVEHGGIIYITGGFKSYITDLCSSQSRANDPPAPQKASKQFSACFARIQIHSSNLQSHLGL